MQISINYANELKLFIYHDGDGHFWIRHPKLQVGTEFRKEILTNKHVITFYLQKMQKQGAMESLGAL